MQRKDDNGASNKRGIITALKFIHYTMKRNYGFGLGNASSFGWFKEVYMLVLYFFFLIYRSCIR